MNAIPPGTGVAAFDYDALAEANLTDVASPDDPVVVEAVSSKVALTRRDLVEVERLAGQPFGKLFPDGEPTAIGGLAAQYVIEKKQGATALSFDEWMDQEVEIEVAVDSGGAEGNPT